MLIRTVVFICLVLLIFESCQQESSTIPSQSQAFFDLSNYFKKEQVRLQSLNNFTKKAIINGKVEEKHFTTLNFKKELALFIDSDINKVSWLDKYEVDSSFTQKILSHIDYTAVDERLKTQFLSIHFTDGQVSRIRALRKSSSIAATMEQELIYEPTTGYSIESSQNTKFADPEVIQLQVTF